MKIKIVFVLLVITCIIVCCLSEEFRMVGEEKESTHRRLNGRHHVVSRSPVTDDGESKGEEQEMGPHHYRHYRCSACVKDRDKRAREREIEHANELMEKFETQTNAGLALATVQALQTSDAVYDSTKGLLVNITETPSAVTTVATTSTVNITSAATPKLRTRR